MAFHDVSMPEGIARGFGAVPTFSRTIVTHKNSPVEKINLDDDTARRLFDLRYPLSRDKYEEVIEFWFPKKSIHSFRVKDFSDYKLGDHETGVFKAIDSGDGAEVNFQIYKRRSSGGFNHDDVLTKIVAGTLRVKDNGVEVFDPADWSVNLITGIITFAVAPLNLNVITVACEFDRVVRFLEASLPLEILHSDLGEVTSLPLIEVPSE